MKKLLFALAVFMALPFFGNSQSTTKDTQSIKWMTFEEAIKLNEKQPRKIIIDVYTTWCGWCKRMDNSTFTDPAVIKYINDNFYAVKFDAESSNPIMYKGTKYTNKGRTHDLTFKLLGDDFGYPAYAFLDENNDVVFTTLGYMDAGEFIKKLQSVVNNTFRK